MSLAASYCYDAADSGTLSLDACRFWYFKSGTEKEPECRMLVATTLHFDEDKVMLMGLIYQRSQMTSMSLLQLYLQILQCPHDINRELGYLFIH